MKASSIISAFASISAALAHTIFVQLETEGKTYDVSYAIRTPTYDGPITDVNSNSLACNGPPNPTSPSDKIIQVKAGSDITAIWRHTLTSGANDVMDPSHKGPTMAYMKKVSDAIHDNGVGNGWFKVQEDGLTNGNWATVKVINNGGKHVIHLPECIPEGQYLLRPEMIALHGARTTGGAQLYMECAQLNVTGGTATKTPTTYSIPGIYKANDPGILVDIYNMKGTYQIPGPRPFTC
ncbi:Glycosyl hydrolase family 61-domain-containing protein [Pleurostoma richardsiae]|uniref:lytic cellulose monooxygenase (C4-dehydrogenating) n=1 Tax=Pleurostoma richardsiae TaxID=41990 RepID=A0AA38VPF8_9PEZI|nr:Glycosyl hydrolase family 61-domain-containing protein [Pleurostoma richardsiae]